MLVEADVVRDRTVTSWPSVRTDLENAGAAWVDRACVCHLGHITSRKPDDLPEFCQKTIEKFAEGENVGQVAEGENVGQVAESKRAVAAEVIGPASIND